MKSFDKSLLMRLFKDSFRKQIRNYSFAIVSMILVAVTTAASAWIMRDIVNEMIISKDLQKVLSIAAMVFFIFTIKGAAAYMQAYYMSKAGNRIIAEKQQELYSHILAQDATYFQKHQSSDLLTRITYNAQAARNVVEILVASFVRDSLTLIGLVAVMVIQQPFLALGALAFGPIALFGVRILVKKARHYMKLELSSLGQLMHIVQETTRGIRVVKSFALEPMLKGRMDKAVRDIEKQSNRMARLEAATSPIMETLAGIAIAGMLALSGVLVLRYGQTPGELMSFITALLLAYEPAKRLARMRVTLEGGMVGVRGLFELLDHPIALQEKPDAVPLKVTKGAIAVDNLSFSYVAGTPVLNSLTASFKPGKMTAIVGPSGSGKSTIINLVMRLFDPDNGSIRIDGQDLRDVTFATLREAIAYVGQDTFLFTGTVRDNIALGRQTASEEEIIAAAKAANAHEFILSLAEGYDTQVGDGGGNVSGGQRQRITIARAILRDAPILILDEPTSSLDSESELAIAEALERLSKGRTTIIIAHRLSTISRADDVKVLEHGRLVEEGSPRDLFEKKGRFEQLFASQALQLV
jgi:ATP-binding cassette, subfamily B, bacterial MsbA